jgi:hypothetical protein
MLRAWYIDKEDDANRAAVTFLTGLSKKDPAVMIIQADCIGHIMRTADNSSKRELFNGMRDWYLEKGDDASKAAAVLALQAVDGHNPDAVKIYTNPVRLIDSPAMNQERNSTNTTITNVGLMVGGETIDREVKGLNLERRGAPNSLAAEADESPLIDSGGTNQPLEGDDNGGRLQRRKGTRHRLATVTPLSCCPTELKGSLKEEGTASNDSVDRRGQETQESGDVLDLHTEAQGKHPRHHVGHPVQSKDGLLQRSRPQGQQRQQPAEEEDGDSHP